MLKQTYLWRALNEHFTVVTFRGESALACDFCLLLFNQCTVCDDNVHVFHNIEGLFRLAEDAFAGFDG